MLRNEVLNAAPIEWAERWFHAMGSDVHVQVRTASAEPTAVIGERAAPALVDDIGERLDEFEQCWSRFRPTSELTRLNEDARPTVEVSPLLMAALHRAQIGWELTDGHFDPTVHDSLVDAGYGEPYSPGRTCGDLTQCAPAPGMRQVRLDLEHNLVGRPQGVRFDLGGIGKGLAADLLANLLIDRGADGVCIGMGGDVRVAGTPPAGGWRIPVELPHTGKVDAPGTTWFEATLDGGAIVTSTRLLRRWTTTTGEPAHHLIDPMTGRPAVGDVDAVVVAAAEAWWAEVLAKAAVVAGHEQGSRLLERHGVTAWVVPEPSTSAAAATHTAVEVAA